MEPVILRTPPPATTTDVPDPLRNHSARRAFGYAADRAELAEEEAAAIRDAANRVLAGETLSSIVKDWNRRGLRTVKGGPWRVNSLSGMLLHPRLVQEPAILDPETHGRLAALHASRRKGPRRATRQYLLTGLLRCWRCGGTLRGMSRARGADLYVCPGPPHGGCSGTAITADHAEEAVTDLVLARLDSLAGRPGAVDGHDAVQALAAHRRRLLELGELWASGAVSREEWLALKASISRRVTAAEARVARVNRLAVLRGVAGAGPLLRSRWSAMGIDERREVVQAALDHVVVLAAEPPRQVFRAERLQPRWME